MTSCSKNGILGSGLCFFSFIKVCMWECTKLLNLCYVLTKHLLSFNLVFLNREFVKSLLGGSFPFLIWPTPNMITNTWVCRSRLSFICDRVKFPKKGSWQLAIYVIMMCDPNPVMIYSYSHWYMATDLPSTTKEQQKQQTTYLMLRLLLIFNHFTTDLYIYIFK